MRCFSLRDSLDKYQVTSLVVPPQTELRINHNFSRNVYLKLTDGAAEIAGCEMTFNFYQLPPQLKSLGVYSHPGCKVDLICDPDFQKNIRYYLQSDEDGYFGQLFAFNSLLEAHRRHAFANLQLGPKVLVLGAESSGKMTLVRTLINYGVKNEWKPILVDLDPLDSKLTAFGAISAAVVGEFLPFSLGELSKLAFFFGYDSLKDRFELYSKQVKGLCAQVTQKVESQLEKFKHALAGGVFLEGDHQQEYLGVLRERLERGQKEKEEQPPRFVISKISNGFGDASKEGGSAGDTGTASGQQSNEALIKRVLQADTQQLQHDFSVKLVNDYIDKEIFASGVFYNVPNEVSELKPSEIQELVDLLAPDYVLVIANDYLRHQVQGAIAGKPVTLIRFPKNGGVSWLESAERKDLRAMQVQNYFNSELLMCVRDTRMTADITVYQIESAANSPLKYIKAVSDRNLILKKIDFSTVQLRGMFLGLINLPASDKVDVDDILAAELIALLYVVDFDDRTISLKRPEGIPENYHRLVMCLGNLGV